MVYDHAQSPRIGQPTPVESTTVRIFTGATLPEVAWTGQVIYRSDTQEMQVYNGDAWEDVVGGQFGLLTFVGPEEPMAQNLGDLWFDSDEGNKLYRWDGSFWVSVQDEGISQAISEASAASSNASTALETAQKKNSIYYSPDPPPGTQHKVADMWFDTNDGNRMYSWNGTSWAVSDVDIRDFTVTARKVQSARHMLY